jgi:hypothetical protein
MIHNQVEFAVLVKGRPITEYHFRGQVFIEGRASSEYEIQLRNRSPRRVEIVLSVDGLSVVDGKLAGEQSRGYLVDANATINIPGWTLDNQSIAKFAFTGKEESYSTQMTGEARNNGVIGVMAFAEKIVHNYSHLGSPMVRNISAGPESLSPFHIQTYYSGNGNSNSRQYSSNTKSARSFGNAQFSATASASPGVSHSVNASTTDYYMAQRSNHGTQVESLPTNSLGTAFGESAAFATQQIAFNRGDMLAMMVMYYDEARGLKARGIRIERPSRKQRYQQQPEAFPAMRTGCEPPPGWKG